MTGLFFQDYNSEGHLTRRLNEAGCPNVIKVLEWAYLEPEPMPLHDISLIALPEEPKFRIAYEVADHGDLYGVIKWYKEHKYVSSTTSRRGSHPLPHSETLCRFLETGADARLVSSSPKRSCGTCSTVSSTRSAIAHSGKTPVPNGRRGGRRLCMRI